MSVSSEVAVPSGPLVDAQRYWFSAPIGDAHTPRLGTAPVRSSAATLRHDFVLLAGISGRSD